MPALLVEHLVLELFLLRWRSHALHWAAEQQDVRLRLVDHVVDPAVALLDAEAAPFRLAHQVCLGHQFRDVLR